VSSGPQRPARWLPGVAWIAFLGFALVSCEWRASAPVVVKIGVVAPYEGVGRELGYAILPIVKDELASANRAGSLGPYRVALVALNDDLDPAGAAAQASALALDQDVLAVIGLWSEATARSAVPVLEKAGMAVLEPALDSGAGVGNLSLCPSPDRVAAELLRGVQASDGSPVVVTGPDNRLRRALLERSPELPVVSESAPRPCAAGSSGDCRVIHTGGAVEAAEALVRWRAAGWHGPFVVSPDAARPWLIPQAGAAAEGVRAVTCGHVDALAAHQDASVAAAANMTGAATRAILSELGRVIADGEQPTRRGVAESLSSHAPAQNLAWIEVMRGGWVPLRE
jgi:hypothetical protein